MATAFMTLRELTLHTSHSFETRHAESVNTLKPTMFLISGRDNSRNGEDINIP